MTAYVVKNRFDKYSVYTYNLSLEDNLITHNKDKAAIRLLNISKLIEKNFQVVNVNLSIADFVKIIKETDRNLFIVEDDEGNFLGWVQLGEIINLLLDVSNHEKTCVGDIMTIPPAKIASNDRPTKIILKFDQTNSWQLPVVEKDKFIGMLSKSNILHKYRESIIESSDD